MNAVNPLRLSSDVFAINRKCCATSPPVMNHLWPCTTHLSPRLSAVVSIMPGSDPLPPARLLFRRGDLVQHDHVAVVGRRAVHDDRAEQRPVHLLVAGGHSDA